MNETPKAFDYGSVCSGIEATSVAWQPLGFQPAWFAEIDPFANAVLNHHYPKVRNLGDMTDITAQILNGDAYAPDLLVGGTPCQSFSTMGLRGGLADPRGALTLTYTEIANAIDQVREAAKKPASILVWENVPGVLTDSTNAFGCLLGALAGEPRQLEPPGKKWSNAGCVYGPRRSIAWRTLDAQHFGLAQRRKRVFVVASARTDFDPAEILFEFHSVRRDSPPGHQARQEAAGDTRSRSAKPGAELPSEADPRSPLVCFGGERTGGPIDAAACLTARGHKCDFAVETFAVHAIAGNLSHTLTARSGRGSSEDGTGRGTPIVAMSYQYGTGLRAEYASPTFAFAQNSRGELRLEAGDGHLTGAVSAGGGKPGQGLPTVAYPMPTTSSAHMRLEHIPLSRSREHQWSQWRVRRLMPLECERLQGMPDNYTLVPYRGRLAADGPRYRAIGQSMAVQCMRWIGARIQSSFVGHSSALRN